MKKILFSHLLFTSKACHKRHFQMKNISASICSTVTLTSRFQYMSTEVANRAERVKTLGKGCMLYKGDISRAFRHAKLDPSEYDLLGLCDIDWYIDTCLPFGY